MNEARHSTAIHEAGHAVISYALGRRLMSAVLLDDRRGEVIPQCSTCDTCFDYYRKKDPTEKPHSRRIQDDLRRDAAVAMAGEIAEIATCGDGHIDPGEKGRDRFLSRSRASMIHLWVNGDCYNTGKWRALLPCELCDGYLESLKQAVEEMVSQPNIKSCIVALAEQLENGERKCEYDIDKFLESKGLTSNSGFHLLPPAPEPDRKST